jgi:hypothetical protein
MERGRGCKLDLIYSKKCPHQVASRKLAIQKLSNICMSPYFGLYYFIPVISFVKTEWSAQYSNE